ncbi:MAG: laccase domain-containing protein [Ruminococcus sp.]|uniref:laccase domain-containing protein n=1 Tax=Ruminococcus sp. TaxID=41978 RepID=UPI0025F1A270|nr:laccase domain-containing protein [Ruminococcus sp.]MCR5600102.1 laccase domain-containing protein [Ruminococcus sp.]
MRKDIIIDDGFAFGGFTAGNSGVWTREKADDPPSEDYISLSKELGVSVGRIVRPYQAGGEKVAVAGFEHGGCGVVREDPFTVTDGLVTNCRGLVLSIIAADCVPIYLYDESVGVIGLLHCGRQAAAGDLLRNAVETMTRLGAAAERCLSAKMN